MISVFGKMMSYFVLLCQLGSAVGFLHSSIGKIGGDLRITGASGKYSLANVVPQRSQLKATTLDPSIGDAVISDDKYAKASDKKQFDWLKQWYPIAVDQYTDRGRPHKLELLGNDIALWHDGSKWRVFEDSCPHRGVPLSEGRVEPNGQLMCAYHAWTFDGEGKCTGIPQTKTPEKEEALKQNARSCAKSYPTQTAQGLIWVWGEKGTPGSDVALDAAMKPPQLIEDLDDPELKERIGSVVWNFRDIPYGWDFFMENTLDPAHVPVSHHGIVGNRYTQAVYLNMSTAPSRTEIPISQGGSFNDKYPEDVGFNQRIDNPAIAETGESYSYNDFRPPCLNKIESFNPDGSKLILALYATPTRPGYCRHIGAQVLVKNKENKIPKGLGFYDLPLPIWLLHMTASLFLHQDQVFLHHQERKLYHTANYAFGNFKAATDSNLSELKNDPKSYAKDYFTPNEHDMGITNLRRWIHQRAGGGPEWGKSALMKGLPAVLPPADLFDVHEAHTKNCQVCQTALKNMKRLRTAGLVGLGLLATLFRVSVLSRVPNWVTVMGAVVCGSTALITHKLMKLFYKFEFSHQDNN